MSIEQQKTKDRNYLVPFVLVTSLFFLWGFARAILDVLNKHFQNALHISITHSALIQVTTYLGYFLMAIPAGIFFYRYGYRRGVVFGLMLFPAVYPRRFGRQFLCLSVLPVHHRVRTGVLGDGSQSLCHRVGQQGDGDKSPQSVPVF